MGEGFERYTGSGNGVEHEAGYDAYMTGVIYLAFIAFIHEKQEESPSKEIPLKRKRSEAEETNGDKEQKKDEQAEEGKEHTSSESSSDSSSEEEGEASNSDEEENRSIFMDKSVTPYYGKIYLMRSDIPYINLKGEEEIGN